MYITVLGSDFAANIILLIGDCVHFQGNRAGIQKSNRERENWMEDSSYHQRKSY